MMQMYYNFFQFFAQIKLLFGIILEELIFMNLTKEQKLHSDKNLKNRYEILGKLGEGCFGSIYGAINLANKKEVALKIQFINECPDQEKRRVSLTNQIIILDKLKSVEGVPKIYHAGKWSYGVYIQIQLYQSSLHDQRHHNYTETEIYKIAIQLIEILKRIHSKNVIHQDLKPQNIMRKKDGSLVIIDFGLSLLLSEPKNQNKKRGFVGTPRYASCAAHRGECQKPKDDIQSLLYVLGVAYTKQAPWFEMKGPIQEKLSKILKIKQAYSEQWLKKCGNAFIASFQYIKNLKNNQQIDYSFLISLFQAQRKSYIVKTLKFQNPINKLARRKSGGDAEKYFMQVPTINLHLIEGKKVRKERKKKNKSINNESTQEINSSCPNYSELAQDGHIQILQALTDKILAMFQSNQILPEENIQSNSINEKEPQIFNITKLEGLHFKNPFKS